VSERSVPINIKTLSHCITTESSRSPAKDQILLKGGLVLQDEDDGECTNVSDSSGTSIENKVPNHYQANRIIIGHNSRVKPEYPIISIHDEIRPNITNVESMV
jgi:hypothetical protein